LASLAAKRDQFDQAMFEQSLVHHKSGLQFLASPDPFSDFRAIRPELILKTLQFARHAFSYIVVDLEDCEHDEQVRVLAASERIILIMRPDFSCVRRTKRYVEYLQRAKVSTDQLRLVVNRVGSPKSLTTRQIEDVLGIAVDYQFAEEAEPVNESVNL